MRQSAHKLGMASKPHPPQTVIMLALGLGQTIAFASSFYLIGVLGDDIAADLRLFGLARAPVLLPLTIWGPEGYADRSAVLGRPAQIAQIGGPALYGLAIDRSPTLALTGGAALCLVMFAMTFGLNKEPST